MRTVHKKQLFFAAAVVVVVIVCLSGYFIMTNNSNQRLTESQIAELRNTYPICGTKAPALISIYTLFGGGDRKVGYFYLWNRSGRFF